ncbi:EamA family transporter [Mangrovimonas futianensis]|uniref:EamA family transporter n=1 Tax=Mangrovimonas futianensis TaxID=2895523 RepID=UPI001E2ED086|nr:EamA family transporter [Mangrovimonas futianensis]MCF1422907.1 EamA family transporter [Mangrovimonas futianensis]
MGKRIKLDIILAYFLIYVVWGSTYFFIDVALKGFPIFLLGTLRFSVAGIIMLMWCCQRGEALFDKKLIIRSAISGFMLLFVDMTVIMLSEQYVTSSLVAIISASTAIWITLLDVPMWKNNFKNTWVILGISLGFIGVLLLYVEQYVSHKLDSSHNYGIAILIFGCISWALGTLFTKYVTSNEEKSKGFSGTAWQMIFASLMFGIFSLGRRETVSIDFQNVPVSSWFSLVYLIVLGSVLAYSAYIWLLNKRPATEVGTHAYVNPLVAVFFGSWIGNELVSILQIFGLFVICVGVMLVNKTIKQNKINLK